MARFSPCFRLLGILLAAAGPVRAAEWTDTRTAGPFVCRADFSLADQQGLLQDLTRLQADLTRALGIRPAAEPIEVYLFHDRATYARYLAGYLPGVPYRRALYAKGRGPGRVFAYRGEQFEIDLRHECTHALLHAALPRVPLWLDEGLAVYFQLPERQRAFDNPHLQRLREDARLGVVPSLEALEKLDALGDMRLAEYRDSWAWVHFMLHGPAAAQEELAAYVAGLRGPSPPPALSGRLRQRMPDVQQRFLEHFRTWRRPG
jgi:hypothetical protein